jgi:hypothetical protein
MGRASSDSLGAVNPYSVDQLVEGRQCRDFDAAALRPARGMIAAP